MCNSVSGWLSRFRSLSQACSSDIVYAAASVGRNRANEQNRQLASHTLVGSSRRL